ncbi:MAG: hypothetical protein LBH86_04500 [Oscillospiraceae bacterium]|nr:hypothetical protein [Oscillospiraceae bacterium]
MVQLPKKQKELAGLLASECNGAGDIMPKTVSEMTGREMWGIYFSYADKPEHSDVVNDIVNRREAIKVADAVLRSISTDPDMRAKYRSRMKFQTDLNTTMAIREDQASHNRANMIARNLFALNLSNADIAKATDLTLDEIKRLRDGE